jgi:hypothetical protein
MTFIVASVYLGVFLRQLSNTLRKLKMNKTSRSNIPWGPLSSYTSPTLPALTPPTLSTIHATATPDNVLTSGDIVHLKSNTGMYFGPSKTQQRKISTTGPSITATGSEQDYAKFINIGGSILEITRHPTLSAALTEAVPMVIESTSHQNRVALRTGDSFTLRAMDPDLSNHTYLTGVQISIANEVGGVLVYSKISDPVDSSLSSNWVVGWSASAGEVFKQPIVLEKQYSLTSTYATGILSHLTNEPLFQGSNIALINPLVTQMAPTTWSFKRIGRLLVVPHVL